MSYAKNMLNPKQYSKITQGEVRFNKVLASEALKRPNAKDVNFGEKGKCLKKIKWKCEII